MTTIVDDDVYESENKWNWKGIKNSAGGFYVYRRRLSHEGYEKDAGVYLHRVIMNCPNDMEVDHIYHNTLDNRRSELRIVTRSQNNINHKLQNNNTSGYRGVGRYGKSIKWRAQIKINGKIKYLGHHDNIHDAARVRNLAARMYHGYKFAYTNIINEEA